MIKGLLYNWKINNFDYNTVNKLSLDLNILPSIAYVLCCRGFDTKEKAQQFIFPIYDKSLYDPRSMKDIDRAIKRILEAIEKKQKILIAGDYDVDGITSTSLLLYGLTDLGAHVNFFLPHRTIDGYGLSKKTIERAHASGYELVITVDNGISAFEALEYAGKINLDVIVTDHHQPPAILPSGAYCIINPHQKDCPYPFKELAGVGVAFKIIQLLYSLYNKKIPEKIYELFLMGTIADVVPLVEENRFLVSSALSLVSQSHSYAFEVLKQNSKIAVDKTLTSLDIGYSITPQLNALGRLEDPREGVIFLVSNNKNTIEEIGSHLIKVNKKRKEIEVQITDALIAELKEKKFNPQEEACIVRSSKQYPAGIIGLVAARLCQQFGVPTVIFNENDQGILKGSCRSIQECDIFACLQKIDTSLIISFGGHAGAAGISIKKEHEDEFKKQLQSIILQTCDYANLQQKIIIDSEIELDDVGTKLWHDLKLLEPFGAHNPFPQFVIHNITIENPTLLKDAHIKATIKSLNSEIPIIFFNKHEWFDLIKKNQKINASVAVKITENNWNNKQKIELLGIDIMYNNI